MSEIDQRAILDTIEIIRSVKTLFAEQNPYLPVYSALGGAFIGAVSAFIPNYILEKVRDRKERRSTAIQLYAEVRSILEIAEHRRYIQQLEAVVQAFNQGKIVSYSYQVQFSDDRFPIFKSCVARLGVVEVEIQIRVVEFYQLVEAVIQDMKPGGLLNAAPAGVDAYTEALRISERARKIGEDVLMLIASRYRIPSVKSGG